MNSNITYTYNIKKVDNYYYLVEEETDKIIQIYYYFEDALKDAIKLNKQKAKH